MLFNSFSYAIFLPIVFILYWSLPMRFQWAVLLVSSYYFYMSWNAGYILLIVSVTVISYLTALLSEKTADPKKKKLFLLLDVSAGLSLLFVFKYFNFFSQAVAQTAGFFSVPLDPVLIHVILPVGISFYVFQTISYVADVYMGRAAAENHFGKYAAFVAFFPQLVAGPIERTSHLLPQIKSPRTFSYDQASGGLKLMAWGFFKKLVIADTFAGYSDMVFNHVTSFRGFSLLMAVFFFTIQIYCDFSGYSDIALGTAGLFGIELTDNFKSPYFSGSVKEFWSRWHISLSSWFRDYVYIPLGGNRVSKLRHKFNLMITFLASGLWHGADWTFVFWGMVHGLAQVLEGLIPGRKKSRPNWFATVIVFLFVSFAWIFFRASTLNDAYYMITNAFTGITSPLRYLSEGISALELGKKGLLFCLTVMLVLGSYDSASRKTNVIAWIGRRKPVFRWSIYLLLVWSILFLTPASNGKEFIYFQF